MRRKVQAKFASELVYENKLGGGEAVSSVPEAALFKLKAFGREGDGGWVNILIQGENLLGLKALLRMKGEGRLRNPDGSDGARLIYIDPPFSTNLAFRDKEDRKAYDDKLVGAEFLEFMRRRLILLKELLTENGSIYVHLDWKKAHHIKVIMDEVFGAENFLNDIIWSYGGRGAKAIASQFSRNHDIILLYGYKSRVFNQITVEKRIKKGSPGYSIDPSGRWFKTSPRGDYTDESIAQLSREGRVHRTKNGNIRIKYFLKEEGDHIIEERLVGDVWDDIPDGMHLSRVEKTGYPTQKPEALLSRIIRASSNPGDIVLDAFAGSGTTLVAAERLQRRWVGIDSGELSIDTIRKRLLSVDKTNRKEGRPRELPGLSPFIICGLETPLKEGKERSTAKRKGAPGMKAGEAG